MTIDRDMDHDRAVTRAVLTGKRPVADGRTKWLGHQVDSGAARIDEMLLSGATKHKMATARGAVVSTSAIFARRTGYRSSRRLACGCSIGLP